MIYDCIMFNDELDILELRLSYMYKYVDYFVIAECSLTHSNFAKPLYFHENSYKFSKYLDKVKYLEIPPLKQKNSWEGEFYQRDYLKTALNNCNNDDLIIIADVDEIINVDHLLNNNSIHSPCIIEMPMFYYFFNLKTNVAWRRTLITPYHFIKNFPIGDRLNYQNLKPQTLASNDTIDYGWHFSYLFGWNINLYESKLRSFSHQEFNTSYYLDGNRIRTCLSLGIDFLERYSVYKSIEIENEFPILLFNSINNIFSPTEYLYIKPRLIFYFNLYNLRYYWKFIIKLRLSSIIRYFKK